MESLKNIVFLIVAISLVLQATVPPTALAARNEVMSSAAVSKVANDSNGLAKVFQKGFAITLIIIAMSTHNGHY
ncbi:hypothetical protein V6Z11_D09G237700 [Gossypium hirsutum]